MPDKLCVELKSLKLYLWSFRDEGHYFEQVTNQILDDLVHAMKPRRITVIGTLQRARGYHHAGGGPLRGRRRGPPARARATLRAGARVRPDATQSPGASLRAGSPERIGSWERPGSWLHA